MEKHSSQQQQQKSLLSLVVVHPPPSEQLNLTRTAHLRSGRVTKFVMSTRSTHRGKATIKLRVASMEAAAQKLPSEKPPFPRLTRTAILRGVQAALSKGRGTRDGPSSTVAFPNRQRGSLPIPAALRCAVRNAAAKAELGKLLGGDVKEEHDWKEELGQLSRVQLDDVSREAARSVVPDDLASIRRRLLLLDERASAQQRVAAAG